MKLPSSQSSPFTIVLCVCAAFVSTIGCQDPDYKAKQAIREGRLDEYLDKFATSEKERSERIEALRALHFELQTEYARSLEKTLKLIEESYLKDQEHWLEQKPMREEKVYSILGGKPERIPGTWGKMVY